MINNATHILMIDDDEINNFIAQKLIKKSLVDAKITVFTNGDDGLTFLKKGINNESEVPDIIFLDLNMPIMNGWEFLDVYETNILPFIFKKPVIHIISSSVYRNDILKAQTYNFIDKFISKPLSVDKIKELLQQVVQK